MFEWSHLLQEIEMDTYFTPSQALLDLRPMNFGFFKLIILSQSSSDHLERKIRPISVPEKYT